MLMLVLVVRVLPSGSELSLLEACMLRVTLVLRLLVVRLLVVRLSMKFLKTLRVCLSLLSGKVLAAQMMF